MTAIPDAKQTALAQQDSARATVENTEEAKRLASLPATKVAKVYRTLQSNASMQMITPAGGKVVFIAGECITDKPLEQAFLDNEIATGNPYLDPNVGEVEPAVSVADLIKQAEERAVANYIAQTKGANALPSTSDNTGAGQTATTAAASTGADVAPATALSALKDKIAQKAADAGTETK